MGCIIRHFAVAFCAGWSGFLTLPGKNDEKLTDEGLVSLNWMKTGDLIFSMHLCERMEQRGLKKSWILETIEKPDLEMLVANDEIHYFKKDNSFFDKWLKVVVNPEKKLIVTAYFDRDRAKKEQK